MKKSGKVVELMSSKKIAKIATNQADSTSITILMDNYVDVLLPSSKNVIRTGPFLKEQLIAEHGLSFYLEVESNGSKNYYLMDAGFTKIGVPHNIHSLNIDIGNVSSIFLSHGHLDHYASIIEILKLMDRPVPFITHPDSFSPRYFVFPNGRVLGPWKLNKEELEETNAQIMAVKNAVPLGPGIISTGEIDRLTDFEKPMAAARIVKNETITNDPLLDDQGIIINIKGKGLIILSACAHAGIINMIKHSQKLTGEKKILAVIGGFHLVGSSEELLERTISELKKIDPTHLMPTHCTGFKAINTIAKSMPEKFILSSVGSRLIF